MSRFNAGFIQLSRDSFARQDLVRKCEPSAKGCAWCGNQRKSKKLFFYGTWPDGRSPSFERNGFCSLQCRNSYSGG